MSDEYYSSEELDTSYDSTSSEEDETFEEMLEERTIWQDNKIISLQTVRSMFICKNSFLFINTFFCSFPDVTINLMQKLLLLKQIQAEISHC